MIQNEHVFMIIGMLFQPKLFQTSIRINEADSCGPGFLPVRGSTLGMPGPPRRREWDWSKTKIIEVIQISSICVKMYM